MAPTATVAWKDRRLIILDQTVLPTEVAYIQLATVADVWEAIKVLRVRGAPAIGICAAYGVVVAAWNAPAGDARACIVCVKDAITYLGTSRPTAVNLFYALDRMKAIVDTADEDLTKEDLIVALEAEANRIFREDIFMCRAIGEHGASLIQEDCGVLTHCNAGGLATSGYGTALAPMYIAHEQGRSFRVYADETRPLLQGARLTTWELSQAGIDVTLICDNMAAQAMRERRMDLVIVGADRIAANGDTANKIGTYGVAALARWHGIPFYVAAPASTLDMQTPDGDAILIEQRDPDEVTHWQGCRQAPEDITVYNPAFDVTPASLITGFITNKGIITPPYEINLAKALADTTV